MCALSDRYRPADLAWAAIGFGVLAYEAVASTRRHDWELLSEACDRYRKHHPIITHGTIVYLAAHLTRRVPRAVDPLHRLAVLWGRR